MSASFSFGFGGEDVLEESDDDVDENAPGIQNGSEDTFRQPELHAFPKMVSDIARLDPIFAKSLFL